MNEEVCVFKSTLLNLLEKKDDKKQQQKSEIVDPSIIMEMERFFQYQFKASFLKET